VGFEASFEFGGASAFAFGPLTGNGRLTLGIFLRNLYDFTTIERRKIYCDIGGNVVD
jgi:hypothetical protein